MVARPLVGYRKLVLDNFFCLSGPAKMPADIMARLNAACNEILASAEIKKKCSTKASRPARPAGRRSTTS